jgi:two-component system nitrate/nitrite sensor histidine kinase NarX
MIQRLGNKPLLLRVGILMTAVIALALVSILSSTVLARTLEGMAAAINQSGSLRMQSYRIAVALADESNPAAERARQAAALAQEFEERLASPRLVDAIPGKTASEVTRAYAQVTRLWQTEMKAPLAEHIRLLADGAPAASKAVARSHYLAGVDAFVAEIDALVLVLEQVAERRVAALKAIQAVALVLTVLAVAVTMTLVHRRVIRPLGELLACADQVRQSDFSGRSRFTGDDELGRLGAAMNLMAEGLSQSYSALEQRVAEKTQDLARTNRSLDLLYRTTATLSQAPADKGMLHDLLVDIERELHLGPMSLCLCQGGEGHGALLVSTRPITDPSPCAGERCRACRVNGSADEPVPSQTEIAGRRILSFPVGDRDRHFGVLLIDPPDGSEPAPWQQRLLATLAGHIGTALNLQQRMREGRRLALHEERGVIARELHDSLAQSLSYLKIQVTRLTAALDADDPEAPRQILAELREGTNSAYRQLRELLTTFRLKMDDRGLNPALEATVRELGARGAVQIRLDNRLPAGLLTANEEIHVLQIVREALSNVLRHAHAEHAEVRLYATDTGLDVEVSDDGRGIAHQADRTHHHGLTIMRERAVSLGGEIRLEHPPGGGTRVRLSFRPNHGDRPEAMPTVLLGAL